MQMSNLDPCREIFWRTCARLKNNNNKKKLQKKKKKKIFYHIRFNQTKVKYSILLCSLGWEHCIIFRKFGENNVDVQSFDPYRKERRYSERSAQN